MSDGMRVWEDRVRQAIERVTPAVAHLANEPAPNPTKGLKVALKIPTADYKLLDQARRGMRMSWTQFISRLLIILARSIRTGRGPFTGLKYRD